MIIFKRDTKGRLRYLEIEAKGTQVVQTSGLLDGKPNRSIRQCKPKNIGKANETTGEAQAVLEARAIITKKLKEGYHKTREAALEATDLFPMLAQKADLTTLVYPVYAQPKLDGIRCITHSDKKWSRKNRELVNVEHITAPNGVDGELYVHGKSFQAVTSAVKKKSDATLEVQLYVYDCHSCKGTFTERYAELKRMVADTIGVALVPIVMIQNEEELLAYHKQIVKEGYEGTIVRTDTTSYEYNKRAKQLLKLKDFHDEEFKVFDVVESDRRPAEGVIVCELSDGRLFNCGMKASHEERREILKNKHLYVGEQAKVEFFEYTDGGVPRFPVYTGIRWEDDMPM